MLTNEHFVYPEELIAFFEKQLSLEASLDPVFLEHAYHFYLLGKKTNTYSNEVQDFLDEAIENITFSTGQEFLKSIQGTDLNSLILTFPDGVPDYVSQVIPDGYLDTTLATIASAIEYLRARDPSDLDLLLEKESILFPSYLLARGQEERIPEVLEESKSALKKENIVLLNGPDEFPQVYSPAHGILIPISPEGLYGIILQRFLNGATPITPDEFRIAFEEEIMHVSYEWENADQSDPFARMMLRSVSELSTNIENFINKSPTYSVLYNSRWN